MIQQGSLFGQVEVVREARGTVPGVPYQRHSRSSRDAAATIKASAATLRALVLEAVNAAEGWGVTDEELYLGLIAAGKIGAETKDSTIRARRIGMSPPGKECGGVPLIMDSGNERRTRSGRTATVWVGAAWADAKQKGAVSGC